MLGVVSHPMRLAKHAMLHGNCEREIRCSLQYLLQYFPPKYRIHIETLVSATNRPCHLSTILHTIW